MMTGLKKLKQIATSLHLSAATVWVAARWNVRFDNPEELAAQPLPMPGHVLLTFGIVPQTCTNITDNS